MKYTLADSSNFLKKITLIKLWNMLQILSSYYLTRLFGKPVQWGQPFTVSIEPTTACNLKCPECPSGLRAFTRPTGNLKEDFFRKTIDDIHQRLMYLIFYFQGEPYINPKFLDMVSYANQHGIYTITSTNGHFLDEDNARKTIESGLDRIIISIDGTTQEVYEQYRKEGQLSKVLEGTQRLISMKKKMKSKTPHIIFQFMVVKPNEHQIPQIIKLSKEIGVDELKLKTAQVYDYVNGNPLIPENEKYSRYIKSADGSYSFKNGLANNCWKLWHSAVITWNGTVVPCCFDKDAKHVMGDLKQKTLKEIWSDTLYKDFRKKLSKGRSEIDICNNCTEGCKVWS